MYRFSVCKCLIRFIFLGRTLLDSLLTQSDLFFFGRLDALVVGGRVRFTFQSRVISVKSGPGALLGRLEPRDLGGRVVDGLLELLAPLGSEARGPIFCSTLLLLRLLGLGLVRLV